MCLPVFDWLYVRQVPSFPSHLRLHCEIDANRGPRGDPLEQVSPVDFELGVPPEHIRSLQAACIAVQHDVMDHIRVFFGFSTRRRRPTYALAVSRTVCFNLNQQTISVVRFMAANTPVVYLRGMVKEQKENIFVGKLPEPTANVEVTGVSLIEPAVTCAHNCRTEKD